MVSIVRSINMDKVVKSGRSTSYQGRDSEVSSMHLLSQPVNFSPGVEEDDSLSDG